MNEIYVAIGIDFNGTPEFLDASSNYSYVAKSVNNLRKYFKQIKIIMLSNFDTNNIQMTYIDI